MSNMPRLDRTRLTARIELEMRAKLRTYCRDHKMTENDAVQAAIEQLLRSTVASDEDRRWAKEERKRNERNRGK